MHLQQETQLFQTKPIKKEVIDSKKSRVEVTLSKKKEQILIQEEKG